MSESFNKTKQDDAIRQEFYQQAVELLERWKYPRSKTPADMKLEMEALKPYMRRLIASPRLRSVATIKDGGGDTLLHMALTCKAFDLAETLASYSETLEISNEYGLTPLLHAVHLGHLQAAEMLLKHGADASYSAPNGTNALHLLARLKMPPQDMHAYAEHHMELRPGVAATKTAAAVAKNELTSPLASLLILHGADPLAKAPYLPPQPPGTTHAERLERIKPCTPTEIARYAGNKALAKQLMPSTNDYAHHEWIENFRQACHENRVEAKDGALSVPQLIKEGFEEHWISAALLNDALAIASRGNRLEDGKTVDGRNAHSFHRLGEIIKHAQGMLAKQQEESPQR